MFRTPRHLRLAGLFLAAPVLLSAQAKPPVRPVAKPATVDPWAPLLRSRTHTPTPTTAAITPADLKTRLFAFADDSMQGRLLGSAENAQGVEYIAGELKRMGVEPGGSNGSYFQNVPVTDRVFDNATALTVDGTRLVPWVDYLARDQGSDTRSIDGVPLIFAGDFANPATRLPAAQAAGKVVVLYSSTTYPGNPANIPSRQDVGKEYSSAAGILVVGMEGFSAQTLAGYQQPTEGLPGEKTEPLPAYMYITRRVATLLLPGAVETLPVGTVGKSIVGNLQYRESPMAAKVGPRNVIGVVRGSDPTLRNQYVVIGAHNDHIGTVHSGLSDIQRPMAHDSSYVISHLFRLGGADDPPPELNAAQAKQVNDILARVRKQSGGTTARMDSVFNGADDDGSGSMSVLELAQYFAAQPVKPKRSILFVWHVGEEEGLYGSAWFAGHPTVSRDDIVAELNMDMVGRGAAVDQTGNSITGAKLHGGPGYLQAVGSRRLSTELGDLAETVNRTGKHGIVFDYSMDANGHPQNIYCRSDHAEYAKWGIPIIFFTTGGHADYHQLTDEPQYIDYTKMAQVGNFVADLAKHVANLDHRVVVDKPKPDPNATCVQ